MTLHQRAGFVLENEAPDGDPDTEKLLNAFIALVYVQIQRARQHPGRLSPKAMLALARLMHEATEACRYRDELERAAGQQQHPVAAAS